MAQLQLREADHGDGDEGEGRRLVAGGGGGDSGANNSLWGYGKRLLLYTINILSNDPLFNKNWIYKIIKPYRTIMYASFFFFLLFYLMPFMLLLIQQHILKL